MSKSRLSPLVVSILVLTVAATLPSAQAASKQDEGFEWMLQEQKGRPLLVYGIRETDNVQFVATCHSSKRIVVQAATDVSGMENDEDTIIKFRGVWFSQSFKSQVIGVNAESGITGTEFTVGADDSLWPGLIKLKAVRYGLAAMTPNTMEFGEDREQIQDFITACRSDSGGQQAAPPLNDNSCSGLGKLKSKNSNRAVTITFVNKTDAFRGLMWLDFKGQPQDFGNLNPGEKKTINTFVTHPWMFTDGPGNCQEIYLPAAGDTRFNITKSVLSNEAE